MASQRRKRTAQAKILLLEHLRLGALGVQSVTSHTSRAGELRSAPSEPDDLELVLLDTHH